METLLDHRRHHRRWVLAIGLAISLVVLAVAALSERADILRTVAVVCAAVFAGLLATLRPRGSRIDHEGWTVFCDGRSRVFPREQIRAVHLLSWPQGHDTVRVELGDGRIFTVPPACLPESDRLTEALKRLGVPVLRG
jgi:hypothetical protein